MFFFVYLSDTFHLKPRHSLDRLKKKKISIIALIYLSVQQLSTFFQFEY